MKNFFITTALIAVLSFFIQQFLPWWVISIIAFVVALRFKQSAGIAFLSGFAAIFLLWAGYALVISAANEHLLATQIAALLKPLTQGSVAVLFILTGLVGGLVAGFSALSGSLTAMLLND